MVSCSRGLFKTLLNIISVYDLPTELLFSLAVVGRAERPSQEPVDSVDAQSRATVNDGVSTSTSCTLCKVSLSSVQDQRQHVKSDFHRYNLKLNIKQMPPIDEATFFQMIGDLDESLSGSESDTSDDNDEEGKPGESTLTALLKKQAKLHNSNQEEENSSTRKIGAGSAPMFWLSSPKLADDTGLGVYKALLSHSDQEATASSLVDIIKGKQLKATVAKQSGGAKASQPGQNDPHFFLCMIGGGHFAAMIVSLVPELRKGPGGVEERHAIVHAHKTFHRYTTRRKQGGSQSANDNAKGNAHSAGSSIRRYNEMALEADVRNVLGEWKTMIDTAELLFIRATGTTNRKTLFGPYDGQVLRNNDKRLRGFPFSTRRATQTELLRSFHELTRLKVGKLVDPAVEDKPVIKTAPKDPKPKPTAPKLTEEEEAAQLHTNQLQALIRRSKAPGVLQYLTKNQLSPDFSFWPLSEHYHAPTPLHLSASTNSPALVLTLLTKAKANPTVENGDGKTPYDIAGDTRTRDSFRVARHQLGEDAYDWSKTHIPTGITQEESDAKSQQDKVASDAAEARRRKADLDRIQQEDHKMAGRMERKAGAGKTLMEKTGSDRREEETRGLTPELRMKLERERRARAAEERLRRMQGAQ
ncbi:uncharacterized protein A1O9_01892 [Exophiala aquamarina CBS 119918]|uniref:VLRF1 domain-containing protein n=1 Tax=Exophiala aquamarina CBS 119918 TaxID=1182545 RepID=A0A072PKS8_9EURO|nr:uncharacterized protein A1O9_01892 [Exophiala aquamarina CBS 119918]KEF60332.1 hypothetical protein A1O9_01892 [Exophiala aquamarina CBS 119918]